MDDDGRPTKLWARLLFQSRVITPNERWLGLTVLGIALLGAWLILWTFIPNLILSIFTGIFNVFVWIGSLFASSGGGDTSQIVTPSPSPLPSPSPSPSPSPLPSPSPSPFAR